MFHVLSLCYPPGYVISSWTVARSGGRQRVVTEVFETVRVQRTTTAAHARNIASGFLSSAIVLTYQEIPELAATESRHPDELQVLFVRPEHLR